MIWLLLALCVGMAAMLAYMISRMRALQREQEDMEKLRRDNARLARSRDRFARSLREGAAEGEAARSQIGLLLDEVETLEEEQARLRDALLEEKERGTLALREAEIQRTRAASAEREALLCRKEALEKQSVLLEQLKRAEQKLAILEAEQCPIPTADVRPRKSAKPRGSEGKRRIPKALGTQLSMDEYLQEIERQ